jgi:hypothetical protein
VVRRHDGQLVRHRDPAQCAEHHVPRHDVLVQALQLRARRRRDERRAKMECEEAVACVDRSLEPAKSVELVARIEQRFHSELHALERNGVVRGEHGIVGAGARGRRDDDLLPRIDHLGRIVLQTLRPFQARGRVRIRRPLIEPIVGEVGAAHVIAVPSECADDLVDAVGGCTEYDWHRSPLQVVW